MKKFCFPVCLAVLIFSLGSQAQYITAYPEIPRIDVHSHPHFIHYHEGLGTKTSVEKPHLRTSPDYRTIANYLRMRDTLNRRNRVDLAMWISLGGETGIDSINMVSKSRMMTCIRKASGPDHI